MTTFDHLSKVDRTPYTIDEASDMLRDHEARIGELEPILPLIATTEKTWQLLKWAAPMLGVALLTNVQQGTLLWRILHTFLPFIY